MTKESALLAEFVARATPPQAAIAAAAAAVRDTAGVILAGTIEPAARMVQSIAADEGHGDSAVLGTSLRTGAGLAAMANGVAAHALDYDDMCFVSLAHPSCALMPAALAACEMADAPGRTLLEGYVVGFELECRLGKAMNPRHYHERGWHCTSTIGTVGAAAATARVLGLGPGETAHALGIAASSACGLKENLGSMVKPLHAGLAARNGVMAARLAQRGYRASELSLDGPQGFLAAMDAQHRDLALAVRELGTFWDIVTTGITVKLYPSCAATHPPLDVLLDLREGERLDARDVESIDIQVDSMTPRLLIYERPATGLEGKFSMPFCAAAAILDGHVGISTFDLERIQSPDIQAFMPKVTLRANADFDSTPPLSTTIVTVRTRSGRVLQRSSSGARGYPARPAGLAQLSAKFSACARRVLPSAAADQAWVMLSAIEGVEQMSDLTDLLSADANRLLPDAARVS